jgi:hypothetical protein
MILITAVLASSECRHTTSVSRFASEGACCVHASFFGAFGSSLLLAMGQASGFHGFLSSGF